MNRKSLGLLSWLLAAVALATPDEVRADSDGYYCVGPDYIAYQLRGWQWFNRGEHRLTIVHFDANGIRFDGEVVLGEDFQPHAMHCEADFVRLEGWGRSYLQVEVRLDSDIGPVLTSTVYDEDRVFDSADFPALLPNLGDWSQPGVSIIAELPGDTTIELLIDHEEVGGPRWCREIVAWLQMHQGGPPSSLKLYRGFAPCEGPGE